MAANKDNYSKDVVVWVKLKDAAKKEVESFGKKQSEALGKFFTNTFKDITSSLTSAITGAFSSAMKELSKMLEFSQLSNAQTRELAFNYGFNSSQAYGWTKALGAVGLESEEDLYYANEQEIAQFREAFEKYTDRYEKLYDSGFFEKMQDYQYEMQSFKEDMMLEVVEFFMNNKDLIKNGMQALMNIAEFLLQIVNGLGWLFKHEVGGDTTSADIVSQYTTTNNSSSSNKTYTQNNTFNGISKDNDNYMNVIANMTYKQTIEALGGEA